MFKEAAQRLLDRKEITESDFILIKEAEEMIDSGKLDELLKEAGFATEVLSRFVRNPKNTAAGLIRMFGQSSTPAITKAKIALIPLALGAGAAGIGVGTKVIKSKAGQEAIDRAVKMGVKKLSPKAAGKLFPEPNFITRHFNKIKPTAASLAVGTLGIAGGKELYDVAKQKSDIKQSFESMQAAAPMLKQYPKKELKNYFEVVKTFSPRAASNPLVAGALVHKMIEFGGVDHKLVQDIATIEARKPDSLLTEVARSGVKAVTNLPKESIEDI